jgi:hypothetical protein
VAFQNYSPRKPKAPPPLPEGPAVDVVQRPDAKAAEEDSQSKRHGDPHLPESLAVADVLAPLHFFASLVLRRRLGRCPLHLQHVLLLGLAERQTQRVLHDEHASEDGEGGEKRIGVLAEGWVLEVVVVDGNENGKTGQQCRKNDAEVGRQWIRQSSIDHQTRSVDHVEPINELPRIFGGESIALVINHTAGSAYI